MEETLGVIFNIQHYSIHDGPGIRTTVFLKGCPLRCFWCQNPESQDPQPILFFNAERCTGCGSCVDACPEKAIQIVDGKSETDRRRCRGKGKCVEVCPSEARTIMGQYTTAGDVFEDVKEDVLFYQSSGGGVTLSGGEPAAQPDFSESILRLCRNAGIHTAIDTCGFAEWETLKRLLDHADLVLYDLKHMNPDIHRKYTGVSNEIILDNAIKIHRELDLPMLVRVPVLPGFNDSAENLERTAAFVSANLGNGTCVHILPYHRLGQTKYERMEEPEKIIPLEPPSDEAMAGIQVIFEAFDLEVKIGG